jgi:hypothetical protein
MVIPSTVLGGLGQVGCSLLIQSAELVNLVTKDKDDFRCG